MVSSRGGTGTLRSKKLEAGVWGAQPPGETVMPINGNRKGSHAQRGGLSMDAREAKVSPNIPSRDREARR